MMNDESMTKLEWQYDGDYVPSLGAFVIFLIRGTVPGSASVFPPLQRATASVR
jgi:hypothetical protein